MNNELEVFNFGAYNIREINIDGEPWFIAKDICFALGLVNNRDAVSSLEDYMKGVGTTDTLGGIQRMTIINEAGLYALIFKSNKPYAKQFQ